MRPQEEPTGQLHTRHFTFSLTSLRCINLHEHTRTYRHMNAYTPAHVHTQHTQDVFVDLQLTPAQERQLEALVLAGGGIEDDLQPKLKDALAEAEEQLPPLCREVRNGLNAAAVSCSRQAAFKSKLERVVLRVVEKGAKPKAKNGYVAV